MLKTLILKNFRKHEDLTIQFTEGLNAIRGANEQGKSTLYEAIAYAFWGSRALNEALEDVVTWGKAPKDLKVSLVFLHGSVEYTITRSKSGAELSGGGVTASGQSEVTLFIEKLFRASAAVGTATLLASQGALKDNLESSSMALIEKLSNMALIDELIRKVQDQLPCGNTKALDLQVLAYEQMVKPVLDVSELEQQVQIAKAYLGAVEAEHAEVKSSVAFTLKQGQEAAERIRAAQQAQRDRSRLEQEIAALVPVPVPAPPAPTAWELAQLEVAQTEALAVERAWARFSVVPQSLEHEDAKVFAERHAKVYQDILEAQQQVSETNLAIARLQGLLITSTHCGLCDKDLREVPEVVSKNAALNLEIAAKEDFVRACKARIDILAAQHSRGMQILAESSRLANLNLNLSHTELDTTVQPHRLLWVGPAVTALKVVDYAPLIRAATSQESARAAALARNSVVDEQLDVKKAALAIVPDLRITDVDQDWVAQAQAAPARLAAADQARRQAAAAVDTASNALKTAMALYDQKLKAYEDAVAMKQQLKDTVALYHFHNGIIDKLRSARPIVAKKLWSTVLSGVSHYLSIIRSQPSTVSRGDSGFMINGKSHKSYSGSAKDSLGLAIRLMLQKTFLSGVDMLLLDEAAAACDNTREADMLGMLASCGMRQVILVTHSDLADSFAANVITI